MEAILQTLMDLDGVTASMVFDSGGQLLGHVGHSVYDRSLCEQVSGVLVKAIEAVQLQQEGWETITAQYEDGKLILRKVGSHEDRTQVLAVVADGRLNASFATVAIRVAAGKLKKALAGGAASSSLIGTPPPAASSSQPPPSDSRPVLANSGLSWSKISSVGLSRIAVADPASGAFLARAAKELAQHVGPISKVYVEEAVRRVSPDAPFSLALAAQLLEDLSAQIEDPKDRAQFRKALSKAESTSR